MQGPLSAGASEMRGSGWPRGCGRLVASEQVEVRRGAGGGFDRMEVLTKQGGRPTDRETLPRSCFPAIVWKRASLFRTFFVSPDISELWGQRYPPPPHDGCVQSIVMGFTLRDSEGW